MITPSFFNEVILITEAISKLDFMARLSRPKLRLNETFFFFSLFLNFIYFFIFGCTGVFVAEHGLSLVSASKRYSLVAVQGLLTAVTSPFVEHSL